VISLSYFFFIGGHSPFPNSLKHTHTRARARSLSSPTLTLAAPDVLREDLAVAAKLQAAESARRAGLRGLRSLLARPGQEDERDEARSPARPPPHHQGARLVEEENWASAILDSFILAFTDSGMTWLVTLQGSRTYKFKQKQ